MLLWLVVNLLKSKCRVNQWMPAFERRLTKTHKDRIAVTCAASYDFGCGGSRCSVTDIVAKLVEAGLLNSEAATKVRDAIASGMPLDDAVRLPDSVSEEKILRFFAGYFDLPFVDLETKPEKHIPPKELLAKFPVRILLERNLMPLAEDTNGVTIATSRISETVGLDELRLATGLELTPVLAPQAAIGQLIVKCFDIKEQFGPDNVGKRTNEGASVVKPSTWLLETAQGYVQDEIITMVAFVYWGVIDSRPSNDKKNLAMNLLRFGAIGGAVYGAWLSQRRGFVANLGLVAVGTRHVFLLKLGTVPMLGQSEYSVSLPPQLLNHIPYNPEVTNVISFRPLRVSAAGERLHVRVLGKSPARLDSAFSDHGSRLDLRVPRQGNGEFPIDSGAIVAAIERITASFPFPIDLISSIVSLAQPQLDYRAEAAISDPDYAGMFVRAYARQKEDIRRALILAARDGPPSLRSLMARCLRHSAFRYYPGIGGYALGIFFLAVGILCTVLGGSDFVKGFQSASDKVLAMIFEPLFSIGLLCLGILLGPFAWWHNASDHRLEKYLLAEGGGFGGSLDSFLAVIALDGDRSHVNWSEVETAITSNPQFKDRLFAALRGLGKKKRQGLIDSAPINLKEPPTKISRGLFASTARILYLVLWLICLVYGTIQVIHGTGPGRFTTGDWVLFVAIWGLIPAIVVFVLQMYAWFGRQEADATPRR